MTTETTNAEKIDLSQLEFVRLKIPRLIPKDLIESVKGRTFTPEKFYDYQELQVDNPHNFLYALIDPSKKIHGFLWAESNILDGTLFVNTFSIDKAFWGKGKGIEKAVDFLRMLQAKIQAPKVYWLTTNRKFFEKHGFRISKMTMMEYNENKNEGS